MSEGNNSRRKALLKIYRLFDTWAKDFDFACERGCATCCTQSVTMTSLEGELILEYIRTDPGLAPLLEQLPANSPAPAMTTNRFALACLQGEETTGEQQQWNLEPCIFLRENSCTVYPVRSFMCRSFGSRVKCGESGWAEMDPLFLTLNTVIMQCLEHLDRGRPWGNMNTILRILAGTGSNEPEPGSRESHPAEPIPGFLVPPDEADSLHTQLNILLEIIGQG